MPNTEPASPTLSTLGKTLTEYGKLLIEDTRLSIAEKLTGAMTTVALCALIVIFGTAALVFISVAVGFWLSSIMAPLWAFLIVAAFYIVVAVAVVLCRNALIADPIARFISRLVLPAPKTPTDNDKPAAIS